MYGTRVWDVENRCHMTHEIRELDMKRSLHRLLNWTFGRAAWAWAAISACSMLAFRSSGRRASICPKRDKLWPFPGRKGRRKIIFSEEPTGKSPPLQLRVPSWHLQRCLIIFHFLIMPAVRSKGIPSEAIKWNEIWSEVLRGYEICTHWILHCW